MDAHAAAVREAKDHQLGPPMGDRFENLGAFRSISTTIDMYDTGMRHSTRASTRLVVVRQLGESRVRLGRFPFRRRTRRYDSGHRDAITPVGNYEIDLGNLWSALLNLHFDDGHAAGIKYGEKPLSPVWRS